MASLLGVRSLASGMSPSLSVPAGTAPAPGGGAPHALVAVSPLVSHPVEVSNERRVLDEARATQGQGSYPRRDAFTVTTLRAGTDVYTLAPPESPPGYCTSSYTALSATSPADYHARLQVLPGSRSMRTTVRRWRVNRDILVAVGEALAQSSESHRLGGGLQYYIAAAERSALSAGALIDIQSRHPASSSGPGAPISSSSGSGSPPTVP